MKYLMKPLLMIALFILFNPCIVLAGNQQQGQGQNQQSSHVSRVGEKLGVGIANVVTGVVEIPKTIMVSTKKNGIAYGATAGLITGIMQMIGRTMTGTLDLVTFMIPTKSLVHPEYVWNNFNQETTYSSNFQMRR
ncbi:MAG: exosortase system-associated protein, TIGR04073 family [Methylococcaceae bacterium]|nr:exosortase system-associated protein, TIGR04073 family [Methylococcaceae bacterium]